MKNFGLFPKLTLMVILLLLLGEKTYTAYQRVNAENKEVAASTDEIITTTYYQVAPQPVVYSQSQDSIPNSPDGNTSTDTGSVAMFFKSNWAALLALLLALLEGFVRLTPTGRDNSVVNFLKYLIDAIIPNRRDGGGNYG